MKEGMSKWATGHLNTTTTNSMTWDSMKATRRSAAAPFFRYVP
jgi:hypothetical protein